MVEVIETNLFVDNDNRIYDHQSRIIEVEDLDTYCNAFENITAEQYVSNQNKCRGIAFKRIVK